MARSCRAIVWLLYSQHSGTICISISLFLINWAININEVMKYTLAMFGTSLT